MVQTMTLGVGRVIPASILRKSTSGRHRPVSYPGILDVLYVCLTKVSIVLNSAGLNHFLKIIQFREKKTQKVQLEKSYFSADMMNCT